MLTVSVMTQSQKRCSLTVLLPIPETDGPERPSPSRPPQSSLRTLRNWSQHRLVSSQVLKATGGGPAIASVHSSRPISGNEALVNLSPSGHCSTIIDNLLDVDQILDRDTYIGSVERLPADHQMKELHLEDNKPLSQHPPPTAMSTEKRRFLNQQLDKLLSGMPTYTRQSYEQLIYKNHDIFSLNKFDLGRTNSFQHSISLKDKDPVYISNSEVRNHTGQFY